MGNSTSQGPRQEASGIDRPEAMVQRMNESVWELYTPQGIPQVEVLFFHGLEKSDDYEKAFWKTWLCRTDESKSWPKEWLSVSIPSARILSISYDAAARNHPGAMDSYIIAENLIHDIILSSFNVGQMCPVVLVGHCLGGIIIKEVILSSLELMNQSKNRATAEKIGKFLTNCKGVFYYSPPHAGSRIADAIAKMGSINKHIINMLRTLDKDTARTNNRFANVRHHRLQIETTAIAENLETNYMGLTAKFVDEASARVDLDSPLRTVATDHFDVCKPKNDTDPIFTDLVTFIQKVATITVVSTQDRQMAQETL